MAVKSSNQTMKEEVVREYAPIGKYRIRLVRNPQQPDSRTLDIREFVGDSDSFTGFTRRGVRFSNLKDIDSLITVLTIARNQWQA